MARFSKKNTSRDAVLIPSKVDAYTRLNKGSYQALQETLKEKRSALDVKASLASAFNEDSGKEPQSCRLVCEFSLGGRDWCLTTGWHLLDSPIVEWEQVIENEDGEEEVIRHKTVLSKLTVVQPGSLPVVGPEGNEFRCGLAAIVGVGNIGKSPFGHAFAQFVSEGDYGFIRHGEPLAGYSNKLDGMVMALLYSMVTDTVCVVDSFKDILSGSSGAAMKSGLNRGILPEFSSLASAAADCGCLLMTPVNPSDPDEKTSELLAQAMKSNVTTLITPVSSEEWVVLNRTYENGPRESRNLRFKGNEIVTTDRSYSGSAMLSLEDFEAEIKATSSQVSLGNLINRAR